MKITIREATCTLLAAGWLLPLSEAFAFSSWSRSSGTLSSLSAITTALRMSSESSTSSSSNARTAAETVSKEEEERKYRALLNKMSTEMKAAKRGLRSIKSTARQLQELETSHPTVARDTGAISSDLKLALAEAKAADDVYGPNSDESYWRWKNAENAAVGRLNVNCIDEAVASKWDTTNVRYLMEALETHHHDYSAVVDSESLREAVDAIGRIEHLERLVRIELERLTSDQSWKL